MDSIRQIVQEGGGDGVGVLGTVLLLVIGAALCVVGVVWLRSPAGRRARSWVVDGVGESRFGDLVGIRGPVEGRRFSEELNAAVREGTSEDMQVTIDHGLEPRGAVLVLVGEPLAMWLRENPVLGDTIVASALVSSRADAFVAANARRNPTASRNHREEIRSRAEKRTSTDQFTVAYVTYHGTRARAVLADTAEFALEKARRRHGSEIPEGATPQHRPALLPERAREDHAGTEWLTEHFRPSGGTVKPTVSMHAPKPTARAGAAARSDDSPVMTAPMISATASLFEAGGVQSRTLTRGTPLSAGRGAANDFVVGDDLSVSKSHVSVELLERDRVRVIASGSTGTWVDHGDGEQFVRAGSETTCPLPVFVGLGDAKSTSMVITSKTTT
jgi:hypothetical protein